MRLQCLFLVVLVIVGESVVAPADVQKPIDKLKTKLNQVSDQVEKLIETLINHNLTTSTPTTETTRPATSKTKTPTTTTTIPKTSKPECDECTHEVAEHDGKFICKALPIELSPFEASGECKCECGEGEQLETRTCTWFERQGNDKCVAKTFYRAPDDPANPCAHVKFNQTVKCEKYCSRNAGWLDEYVDVGECQISPDYFCGKCETDGSQLQLRKCKALMKKAGSECIVIETDSPTVCGVDQQTVPCKLSHPKPCVIESVHVYTSNRDEASGTDDDLYYSGVDESDNVCQLGLLNLPNHNDLEAGSQTDYYVNKECSNVCLDRTGFKKFIVRTSGNDAWRGNLFVKTNGVYQFYSNGMKWLFDQKYLQYFVDDGPPLPKKSVAQL